MVEITSHTVESIRELLSTIKDPEVPAISIVELGIVRDVQLWENVVTIIITPTYSGCPAMKMIEDEIRSVLTKNGFSMIAIKTIFSPAWTTDWISEPAKLKLKNYGIAPPQSIVQSPLLQIEILKIVCPNCNSNDTKLKSEFGSTSCKSFYYCHSCSQPFEYFKPF
ncbi:MAG: 1,2-phenylacetyl-CoA epoxidase subunit PaaD [Bacteroidota bacterium]|nr:1,2-phenylacetyl-CoA epoxidase subunit PaaD [Bacteroidota bacterium]